MLHGLIHNVKLNGPETGLPPCPALTATMKGHRMANNSITRKSVARKHGHATSNATSREYHIWENMKQRCNNPNASHYERYGGRGISYCEQWEEFANFYADMGDAPSRKHSLDRIDNNGNYAPDNCRWATMQEQMLNSTRVRMIEAFGETMPVYHAIKRAGISPQTFYRRINEGWSIEKALAERPYAKRRKGFIYEG